MLKRKPKGHLKTEKIKIKRMYDLPYIVLKPGFEGRGDQPRMDKLTIARLGNLVPRPFPHLFFNGKALGTRLKIGLQ